MMTEAKTLGTNLLRTMSAGFGAVRRRGLFSLVRFTDTSNDSGRKLRRVLATGSRAISNFLMMEENHLGQVSRRHLWGATFIERLTEELAQSAWPSSTDRSNGGDRT